MKKNPGCFGFVGEFTTRLCGDYEINHYYMKVRVSFFVAQVSPSLRTRYVPAKLWISRNLGKHLLKFVQHIPFQTLTRLDTETTRLKCLQLGAEAGSLLREHAGKRHDCEGNVTSRRHAPAECWTLCFQFWSGLAGGQRGFYSLVKANSTDAVMELLAQPVRRPINTVEELGKAAWAIWSIFCWEEKETKKNTRHLQIQNRNRRRNVTPCRCGSRFFLHG